MNSFIRHLPFAAFIFFFFFAQKASAQCTAAFTYTVKPGGFVLFTSTSTGTNSTTTYAWYFGGSASPSTATTINVSDSTVFSSYGTYSVTLVMTNSTTSCTSSVTIAIPVGPVPPCTIVSSFTTSQGSGGSVNFASTSSGTLSNSTYRWLYGDGYQSLLSDSLLPASNHTYAANGTYVAKLIIKNPGLCVDSISMPVNVNSLCTPTISYVPGSNGTMSLTANVGTIPPGSTFNWNFGNGFSYTGASATDTTYYLSNGVYYVSLTYSAGATSSCVASVTDTILVTNAGCNLTAAASLFSSPGTNTISILPNSTGMDAIATMTINYGDATLPFIGSALQTSPISHVYSSNGNYIISLNVNNNYGSCKDSIVKYVAITSSTTPCNLVAQFSRTVSPSGIGIFKSTSTGTSFNSTYSWQFSDTLGNISGDSVVHVFASHGLQSVSLLVNNNSVPSCTSSAGTLFVIPCSPFSANFSHTVGASGAVDFQSTSQGTGTASTYYWLFGDGTYGTGSSATHAYFNSGAYDVSLIISSVLGCADTVVQSVNITGVPCSPNANFTLSPTSTPYYWTATPEYPWNVIDASWDWGDGSSTASLYASHTYSAAGSYSICLSVTVSCGAGAAGSACASYAVFKTQQQTQNMNMIYVNVKAPGIVNAIKNTVIGPATLLLYPNPNNGQFYLEASDLEPGTVNTSIYDLVGKLIYQTELPSPDGHFTKELKVDPIPAGIYFIKLSAGSHTVTKKLIVNN